jgi:predicted DNA-binding transcriptional regulator AlpA
LSTILGGFFLYNQLLTFQERLISFNGGFTMSRISQKDSLPEVGFLRLPEVLKIFPVGKSTWLAGVQAGLYPRPVRLSKRNVGWRITDIRSLVERLGSSGGA